MAVRAIERALGRPIPRRTLDGFDYAAAPQQMIQRPPARPAASQSRQRAAMPQQPLRHGPRPPATARRDDRPRRDRGSAR